MANIQRKEVEIELCGTKYILRPTFASLVEIEDRLQVGLIPLSSEIIENKGFKVKQLAAVVHAGLKGAGHEMIFEEVQELCFLEGVAKLNAPVMNFFFGAISGGKKEEKKIPEQSESKE
jgi:hypothetical protein